MQMSSAEADVVILGAGMAGMTAAYQVRDRDILVLESRDRVGGRTKSGGDDRTWYNVGAQLITSPRLIAFAQELAIDLIGIGDAGYSIVVDGHFARARTPEGLLLRMALPVSQRLDFGVSALRLRRKLAQVPKLDQAGMLELDQRSLLDTMGHVGPRTNAIWNTFCEVNTGARADQISALIGLSYTLVTFLDKDYRSHIFGVRGGTQRICKRIRDVVGAERVKVSCEVRQVRNDRDGVVVEAVGPDGEHEIRARACVCAMPAQAVIDAVSDLPEAKHNALRRLTPYYTLISAALPVADGRAAPWDDLFLIPVIGEASFNQITNYGYLSKRSDPSLGGYINLISTGVKGDLLRDAPDDEVVALYMADLERFFPGARLVVNSGQAVVQRWSGLPRMRPGYFASRAALRERHGRILFCGDYTAEPGLTGANGSGYHMGRLADQLLGDGAG
jgi:protoporphyrinogen/coproporphyrinogen III oxidase